MASISTSEIMSILPQIDGRRYVTEHHVDDQGASHDYTYLAEVNADINAIMMARRAVILAQLAELEVDNNISGIVDLGSLATPTLKYSTVGQNAAAVRQTYRNSHGISAIMIGDYLSTLTDAQLRVAFSLTQAEVATLRTNKLTPAATAATQIRAVLGE